VLARVVTDITLCSIATDIVAAMAELYAENGGLYGSDAGPTAASARAFDEVEPLR
jgi:hypothetical protein